MTQNIRKLDHGRETYAVKYGEFVMKRPLPNMSEQECAKWLAKQHNTKDTIDAIVAVGNPTYYIPSMHYINDMEYSVLEERAPGARLTRELFRTLSKRQQIEIIDGIAGFLVDMNELKPVQPEIQHKITDEIKFDKLTRFVETKMSASFQRHETAYMARICNEISQFVYPTRNAWSHGDLNPTNVFYDASTSTLSFIDFAEAGYNFIYRDIFASLEMELGIYKKVYEKYLALHDKSKYPMPGMKNTLLPNIMKYRMMIILLKRLMKSADDIHPNTTSERGIKNNIRKISDIRNIISQIQRLEQTFKTR